MSLNPRLDVGAVFSQIFVNQQTDFKKNSNFAA